MSQTDEPYRERGFFLVRDVSPEFRQLAEEAFQASLRLLEMPDGIQKKWTHDSGKVKHLVNPHRREPVFRRLIESPEVLRGLQRVFATAPAYVTHSKLSFKFAGSDQIWLPHQDTAYKAHRGQLATFGVFLEDCSERNGGLQLFPGSHKLGPLKHEILFAEGESDPQIRVKEMPQISPETIEGPRGSVLVFDGNMIHQSGENHLGGVRAIFLFEVEPVRSFAMEADGRDAILLNGTPSKAPSGWKKALVRQGLRFVELGLKPPAKRILHFLHRRILRRQSASLRESKA